MSDGVIVIIFSTVSIAITVVVMYLLTRRGGVAKIVPEAIEARDISIIVGAIEEQALTGSSTAWHKCLDKLWRAYERELAAKLILEAQKHDHRDLTRQWTQRVVEVEPDMALRILGRRFVLDTLELPDEAIPERGPRAPRRGERQVSKKKGKRKKKKR